MDKSKLKIDFGLWYDKIFRKTMFLRPMSDKTWDAIDITGTSNLYLNDITGATFLDPICIIKVRGIKRVDRILIKPFGSSTCFNPFENNKISIQIPSETLNCLACNYIIPIPARELNVNVPKVSSLDQKILGNLLDLSEMAGELKGQGNQKEEVGKKMNIIILLVIGAIIFGIYVFYKSKGG